MEVYFLCIAYFCLQISLLHNKSRSAKCRLTGGQQDSHSVGFSCCVMMWQAIGRLSATCSSVVLGWKLSTVRQLQNEWWRGELKGKCGLIFQVFKMLYNICYESLCYDHNAMSKKAYICEFIPYYYSTPSLAVHWITSTIHDKVNNSVCVNVLQKNVLQ